MKKSLLYCLTLLFAVIVLGETSVNADQSNVPLALWYVKRSATHIGSGYTYTQEFGPYSTREEAEAKKAELDAVLSWGSYGYGIAEIYSKANPVFLRLKDLPIQRKLPRPQLIRRNR